MKSLRLSDMAEATQKIHLNLEDILILETNAAQREEAIRTLLVAFNQHMREAFEDTKQIREISHSWYGDKHHYFVEWILRK